MMAAGCLLSRWRNRTHGGGGGGGGVEELAVTAVGVAMSVVAACCFRLRRRGCCALRTCSCDGGGNGGCCGEVVSSCRGVGGGVGGAEAMTAAAMSAAISKAAMSAAMSAQTPLSCRSAHLQFTAVLCSLLLCCSLGCSAAALGGCAFSRKATTNDRTHSNTNASTPTHQRKHPNTPTQGHNNNVEKQYYFDNVTTLSNRHMPYDR